MKEVFSGFNLELIMDNICYEVEQSFIDPVKNLLIISADIEKVTPEAELVISDTQRLYASAKIKIKENRRDNEKTILVCESSPQDFHFFKRGFLRVKTDINVDYLFLEAGPQEDLQPVSVMRRGTIRDLSPCGALLGISNKEKQLLNYYGNPAIYLKLMFQLPDKSAKLHPMEIIGKIVKVKKSWDAFYVGVLFLITSFQQHRLLDAFYHENTAAGNDNPAVANPEFIKKLFD